LRFASCLRLKALGLYLHSAHARHEVTALMSNIVVMGKKNLNPGRSITISPGR